MKSLAAAVGRLAEGGAVTLSRAPEGFDAFVVAELARSLARAGEERAAALVFVARDGVRAQSFIDALGFAAPEVEALYLPSWDCQPYDRVSPNAAVSAQRMTALARLARTRGALERPRALVVTVNALAQRVPPLKFVAGAAFSAAPGNSVRHGGSRAVAGDQRLRPRQLGARRRRLCDARRHSRSLSARRAGADPARFLRRHARVDPLVRSGDPAQRRPVARARSGADERSAADEPSRSAVSARPTPPNSARRGAATRSTRRSARGVARSASNIGCRCSTSGWTRCSITPPARRSSSTRASRTPRTSASSRSPTITARA